MKIIRSVCAKICQISEFSVNKTCLGTTADTRKVWNSSLCDLFRVSLESLVLRAPLVQRVLKVFQAKTEDLEFRAKAVRLVKGAWPVRWGLPDPPATTASR